MRFWTRRTTHTPAGTPDCFDCDAGLDHCHGTLVLHADGTLDCDGLDECHGEEARHELWMSCTELGCGCTGEEHDLVLAA